MRGQKITRMHNKWVHFAPVIVMYKYILLEKQIQPNKCILE